MPKETWRSQKKRIKIIGWYQGFIKINSWKGRLIPELLGKSSSITQINSITSFRKRWFNKRFRESINEVNWNQRIINLRSRITELKNIKLCRSRKSKIRLGILNGKRESKIIHYFRQY